MAPAFIHGRGTKVALNKYSMSPFLSNTSISGSAGTNEITTYALNDKQFVVGMVDRTVKFDGYFSSTSSTALAKVLDAQLGGTTKMVLTIGPDGDTLGNPAIMLYGDPTGYDVSSPASDVVSISLDAQGSGHGGYGVWLRPMSTGSSTGSNTGVTCTHSTGAGGSTGGGTGHFHLVSASTLGTMTVKVQHSTSGSTWVNLITFTAATAETFQRSTVSGTVKERLRATCSAMTGGGAVTATWAVAFARHGKYRG